MTGVWEFPDLDELQEFLELGPQIAIQALQEEDDAPPQADLIQLREIFIVDEWGDGTAEIGGDTLDVVYIVDAEGLDNPSINEQFNTTVRILLQTFNTLLNRGVIETPPIINEWFTFIDPNHIGVDRREDALMTQLSAREGKSIYNLTERHRVEFVGPVGDEPGPGFDQLPRTSQEMLEEQMEDEEEEDEEPEGLTREEIFGDDEEEDEEPEEEEEDEPEEPPTADELLDEIDDDGTLRIDGLNETKEVERRDPYSFEIEMVAPNVPLSTQLRGLESRIDIDSEERGIRDELHVDSQLQFVGKATAGDEFGERVPIGTFPRTGTYINYRLRYQGPTYVYRLYKDLMLYTGLIREFYDVEFTTSTYQNFRKYLNTLKRLTDLDEGPDLIENLSQQAAASRGFETIADHPSIEGEKAPWLERRSFYRLIEENQEHEAWINPYEYLQELLDEED